MRLSEAQVGMQPAARLGIKDSESLGKARHTVGTMKNEMIVHNKGCVNMLFLMMLRDGVMIMNVIGLILKVLNGIHTGTEGNRAAEGRIRAQPMVRCGARESAR